MINTDPPVSDPTPNLAPTAKRILDAAIRVLDEHGFAGLTFQRIAQESGENGALIRYHFGSKAGLVTALVDVVLFAEARHLLAMLSPLPPHRERREALFRHQQEVATQLTRFMRFYELAPNMLRDPELRVKLRDFLRWYRTFDGWALTGEYAGEQGVGDAARLGLLSVAMLDGLALHVQAEPDLDVGPAFELWRQMVMEYLEKRQDIPSA